MLLSSNKCLQCSKKLTGRIDKKFCDSYCRNTYNNRHQRSDEAYIKTVNSIIRKNRRILKTLCPMGKATVRREVLESTGYNFIHFSNVYRTNNNTFYYMCYDYGFTPVKEGAKQKALIIQKQDYFDRYKLDPWRFIN